MNQYKEITEKIMDSLIGAQLNVFQHCNETIICIKLPKMCPNCKKTLKIDNNSLKIPPFVLVSPFSTKPVATRLILIVNIFK